MRYAIIAIALFCYALPMSRWKQPEAEITDSAIYMRDWSETAAGKAWKKRSAENARTWRAENHERFLFTQKRAYDAMRLECLQHYSKPIPECACCGETTIEFLQIDHADGSGAAHRRQIGMRQGGSSQSPGQKHKVTVGGNGLPYWLKKNNWPDGFRVLCANCNLAKRASKYCPHELARGVDLAGDTISEAILHPTPPDGFRPRKSRRSVVGA